jgi:hypothetical protein
VQCSTLKLTGLSVLHSGRLWMSGWIVCVARCCQRLSIQSLSLYSPLYSLYRWRYDLSGWIGCVSRSRQQLRIQSMSDSFERLQRFEIFKRVKIFTIFSWLRKRLWIQTLPLVIMGNVRLPLVMSCWLSIFLADNNGLINSFFIDDWFFEFLVIVENYGEGLWIHNSKLLHTRRQVTPKLTPCWLTPSSFPKPAIPL